MKKLLIITVFGVMALQMQAQGIVDPNRSGSAAQLRAQGYVGGFVDTNRNKKIVCTCGPKCKTDTVCIKKGLPMVVSYQDGDSLKTDTLCACEWKQLMKTDRNFLGQDTVTKTKTIKLKGKGLRKGKEIEVPDRPFNPKIVLY